MDLLNFVVPITALDIRHCGTKKTTINMRKAADKYVLKRNEFP